METYQFAFDFDGDGESAPSDGGLPSWRAEREKKIHELARRSGMPIGHPVEVTLSNGPYLLGELRLASESLWIDTDHVEKIVFEVDGTTFRIGEIESCVRRD